MSASGSLKISLGRGVQEGGDSDHSKLCARGNTVSRRREGEMRNPVFNDGDDMNHCEL